MSDLNTISSATRSSRQSKTATSSIEDSPTTTASAKTSSLADDLVSSFADDSIIASDGGNFTDTDDGYYDDSGDTSAAPDAVGNTIFFLAIVAFLAIGLGLGIWLWRKNQRTKAAANGDEKAASTGTGLFHRKQKKGRPSPLPLTNIRTGQEQSLPPYTAGSAFDYASSPFAAGTGQTPLLEGKPSLLRQQQSMRTGDEWDAASSVDTKPPNTPFTPFTPFSPVSLNGNNDTAQARSYVPAVRSSLYHSDTMPQPSPVQYMDPEAAQAMGIHPDVINEAKPGVSDEEIERRRAKAQRRLERQQRAEEGSVVEEERTESPGFRQLARAGEI